MNERGRRIHLRRSQSSSSNSNSGVFHKLSFFLRRRRVTTTLDKFGEPYDKDTTLPDTSSSLCKTMSTSSAPAGNKQITVTTSQLQQQQESDLLLHHYHLHQEYYSDAVPLLVETSSGEEESFETDDASSPPQSRGVIRQNENDTEIQQQNAGYDAESEVDDDDDLFDSDVDCDDGDDDDDDEQEQLEYILQRALSSQGLDEDDDDENKLHEIIFEYTTDESASPLSDHNGFESSIEVTLRSRRQQYLPVGHPMEEGKSYTGDEKAESQLDNQDFESENDRDEDSNFPRAVVLFGGTALSQDEDSYDEYGDDDDDFIDDLDPDQESYDDDDDDFFFHDDDYFNEVEELKAAATSSFFQTLLPPSAPKESLLPLARELAENRPLSPFATTDRYDSAAPTPVLCPITRISSQEQLLEALCRKPSLVNLASMDDGFTEEPTPTVGSSLSDERLSMPGSPLSSKLYHNSCNDTQERLLAVLSPAKHIKQPEAELAELDQFYDACPDPSSLLQLEQQQRRRAKYERESDLYRQNEPQMVSEQETSIVPRTAKFVGRLFRRVQSFFAVVLLLVWSTTVGTLTVLNFCQGSILNHNTLQSPRFYKGPTTGSSSLPVEANPSSPTSGLTGLASVEHDFVPLDLLDRVSHCLHQQGQTEGRGSIKGMRQQDEVRLARCLMERSELFHYY